MREVPAHLLPKRVTIDAQCIFAQLCHATERHAALETAKNQKSCSVPAKSSGEPWVKATSSITHKGWSRRHSSFFFRAISACFFFLTSFNAFYTTAAQAGYFLCCLAAQLLAPVIAKVGIFEKCKQLQPDDCQARPEKSMLVGAVAVLNYACVLCVWCMCNVVGVATCQLHFCVSCIELAVVAA